MADYICELCGSKMVKNGSTRRKIKNLDSELRYVRIQRYWCKKCRTTLQILPDDILPRQHYDKNAYDTITSGKEYYSLYGGPSETTIWRYRNR